MSAMLVLLWPAAGVFGYWLGDGFDGDDQSEMPGMMAWGLFIALLLGPIFIVSTLLHLVTK